MSEMHVLFMFCVFYSGVLTLAIWANIVVQTRVRLHLEQENSPPKFNQGA